MSLKFPSPGHQLCIPDGGVIGAEIARDISDFVTAISPTAAMKAKTRLLGFNRRADLTAGSLPMVLMGSPFVTSVFELIRSFQTVFLSINGAEDGHRPPRPLMTYL
jgi:hypothetical protein